VFDFLCEAIFLGRAKSGTNNLDRRKSKLENSPKHFGQRLALLRKAYGYESPEAFAQVCGVAKQTVYNWELRTDPPPRSGVHKIATAFGLSEAQIRGHAPIESAPEHPPMACGEDPVVVESFGIAGSRIKRLPVEAEKAEDVDALYDELHGIVDSAITAAGEDAERIKWLIRFLRENLRIPIDWLPASQRPKSGLPTTGILVPPAQYQDPKQGRANG
jgi:transcriptional regulator with XRE-family HTH domain